VKVIFTPAADRQMQELHDYIALHSSESMADGYIDRIERYCGRLADFPHRGTPRDEILPGLRTIGFERRVTVAFTLTIDTVLIEGIFYGGQDFATRLKP
jgi:toxin ParE1/3/4